MTHLILRVFNSRAKNFLGGGDSKKECCLPEQAGQTCWGQYQGNELPSGSNLHPTTMNHKPTRMGKATRGKKMNALVLGMTTAVT